MAPRAQAKDIEIVSYIDERVPTNVIGDVARLRQVLLNLLGNAVKFTENGGIGVIVESGDRENEIRIEVRDTGIGISQDDLPRIFHDFEQADGSPTRKYGGTGRACNLQAYHRAYERVHRCYEPTRCRFDL